MPYLGVDTRGLSSGCTLCEHEEDQSLLLIFISFETYATHEEKLYSTEFPSHVSKVKTLLSSAFLYGKYYIHSIN